MMRVIIHETYEYEVEADSVEDAMDRYQEFVEASDGSDEQLITGVKFNQNYMHTYNQDMEEIS